MEMNGQLHALILSLQGRASVDVLNMRLNIYHVNQQTILGHGMFLFYS